MASEVTREQFREEGDFPHLENYERVKYLRYLLYPLASRIMNGALQIIVQTHLRYLITRIQIHSPTPRKYTLQRPAAASWDQGSSLRLLQRIEAETRNCSSIFRHLKHALRLLTCPIPVPNCPESAIPDTRDISAINAIIRRRYTPGQSPYQALMTWTIP